MRCYLIRHGEILSNVKKVYAGTSQESLTEKGEEQVRALAERLKGRGIRILYASPLRRGFPSSLKRN
jgi:broad specificity phosphatase PhoE